MVGHCGKFSSVVQMNFKKKIPLCGHMTKGAQRVYLVQILTQVVTL
jgi:hypothetical protein